MKEGKKAVAGILCSISIFVHAQQNYPQNYFRNPLNIPMELVANFGELRSNHWHMGLDIRTQQQENLRVVAAADGYVARVKIEPGGFGRAVYINHPNGYTTLYAHLNGFIPPLEKWVKEQQYLLESWAVELKVPPYLFPLKKGEFFALSGNTGGSAGPHVHFEIRDTNTDNCLNPLLFGFPIRDLVPPSLIRLAMYDRNRSVHDQSPQIIGLKKTGSVYGFTKPTRIITTTDKVSFALGAVDRFSGSANTNGIYRAQIFLDNQQVSGFVLDNINYEQTRYMNAHTDYRYKYNGGAWLQHLSRMPGDMSSVYTATSSEGIIQLNDGAVHEVRIEVEDAARNVSVVKFMLQFDSTVVKTPDSFSSPRLIPQYINVFEEEEFEVFTTEQTVYDTVTSLYKKNLVGTAVSASPIYTFINPAIPSQDSISVRIKFNVPENLKNKVILLSIAGTRKVVQKGIWNGEWVRAKFRQFGTFQALVDSLPPTINAPPNDLSRSNRILFMPTDNFSSIKRFRAELDGHWLRFTNNGGRAWSYLFDDKFPAGKHELKVIVEDEAGNVTTKIWDVIR